MLAFAAYADTAMKWRFAGRTSVSLPATQRAIAPSGNKIIRQMLL
jgi:hypothetical protein